MMVIDRKARRTSSSAFARSARAEARDVVFDPVGGETFLRSLDCIATGGRLLAIGFASGAWADAPTSRLVAAEPVGGGRRGCRAEPRGRGRDAHATDGALRRRRATPMIAKVLAFEELPEALEQLESGQVRGKQVITVP